MQWLKDAVSSLVSEYPGSPRALQSSGMLSKEKVIEFFKAGEELLDKADVKEQLQVAKHSGRDTEQLITQMQMAVFESLGVEGNFGIQCLGRVNQVYDKDPAVMQAFYRFVAREEAALDEAEMAPDAFQQKQQWLNQLQAQQQKQLQALSLMSPEEQERYIKQQMAIAKQVMQQQERMQERMATMSDAEKQASMEEQIALAKQMASLVTPGNPMPESPRNTMTPEQQMLFFQSVAERPYNPNGELA